MKSPNLLIASLLALGWILPLGAARAGTLYDASGFIQGQQSYVRSFDITATGTLTMTLSEIPWLDSISNLNGFLSSATGILGSPVGTGTESIQVAPGLVYAHWYGSATGANGLGVYGIDISFQPTGGTVVPLPMPWILLLSGLGVLAGFGRRPRSAA